MVISDLNRLNTRVNYLRDIRLLNSKSKQFEPEAPNFTPIRILEVEIGQPLSDLPSFDPVTNQHYHRAMVLVLLHKQLIGIVNLDLPQNGLAAADLASALWTTLKEDICAHLRKDNLPLPDALTASGLTCEDIPSSQQEYMQLLEGGPSVSIIVATHNRTDSLAETLLTLLALDYPNYDILVIDNAPSTSETADFIKDVYGDNDLVRYIREDRPGLGRAHNRGVAETDAEIVAFADDDIIADKGWLTWIVSGFLADENVGCVTGMILPAELQTPAQEWIEQYGGFSKGFTRKVFDMKEHRLSNPLYPYMAGVFGSGANMAFRTSALRDIGGFDDVLGAGTLAMGGDDLDSFLRVVRQGYMLLYEPRSFLYHKHRREYAGLRRQAYGYGVGLTAYLTKCIFDRPMSLFEFLLKAPYGFTHIFSKKSTKNNKKQVGYPSELTRMERQGMLYGPIAYVRSRMKK